MLDTLRSAAGTWVAKLLLLLLVLSFAVWGVSGQLAGGLGSTAVVTAGGTEVSALDYRLAYDRQLSVLSQRFGTRITREQAVALGVDGQVLTQLVAGAVLDEQARDMGLGVSKDRLARLTAEDPAFHGPDGSFDRRQFEFVLRQIGMRPEDYLKNREQVTIRQQIVDAVADGMAIPDTFLRAVSLYQGESRTVDFLILPPGLVDPIADPEPAELEKYFADNKLRYEAPEYRKIAYVKLEPADIADPAAIAAEQVEKDYQDRIASYTTPEKRTIDQLVFSDRDAAQAALDRIRGGANFEAEVMAAGKTAADVGLGTLTRAQVGDDAVAEAAFALERGEVSDIVDGAFGPVLVRVSGIEPETVQPLEEVAEKIRMELALAEASRVLLDVHDSYEDARAGGETMEEAARRLDLEMVTVDAVDRNAQSPQGETISDIPELRELLRQAFETEQGVENPPINIGSSGFVFFEVLDVTPRRERGLDEVRDRVVEDWKAAQRGERLSARAAEIEKRVRDGAPLDEIAQELQVGKQTRRGLKRDAQDADLGEAAVAAAFAVPQGGVGSAGGNEGARIVFKVTEVLEPAGAGADAVPAANRQAFTSGMADDLLDQLVARLQGQYEVRVNQAAMQQALNF